jgi:hypothetical protein
LDLFNYVPYVLNDEIGGDLADSRRRPEWLWLAPGTRLLAAQNVPRIRAATDVGNAPMAAAFARAGYVTFESQFDMTWR